MSLKHSEERLRGTYLELVKKNTHLEENLLEQVKLLLKLFYGCFFCCTTVVVRDWFIFTLQMFYNCYTVDQ